MSAHLEEDGRTNHMDTWRTESFSSRNGKHRDSGLGVCPLCVRNRKEARWTGEHRGRVECRIRGARG